MTEFDLIGKEILKLINEWEEILLKLTNDVISENRNNQNRTIKQIVGHMVDSATNNTHRIIHLQYQNSPCTYPDYANLGNNDRWISIQNYQEENWIDLVQLWKYCNFHIVHVIENVKLDKLENVWVSALNQKVTLKDMIIDYPRHLKLHLEEIRELMSK